MKLLTFVRKPLPYEYRNFLIGIIGINVIVQVLQYAMPSLIIYLGMNPLEILRGRIWQFFTYMFVHDRGNLGHLLFNMLALFFFGRQIERELGSWEFLLFYLSTGVISGLISFFIYLFSGQILSLLVGASGAVFGVVLLFATMHPETRIYVFFMIPMSAGLFIVFHVGYELFMELTNRGSRVSHITHLAGFAWAYAFIYIRYRIDPLKRMFPRIFS